MASRLKNGEIKDVFYCAALVLRQVFGKSIWESFRREAENRARSVRKSFEPDAFNTAVGNTVQHEWLRERNARRRS